MNTPVAVNIIICLVVVVTLLWMARRKRWTLSGRRYAGGGFLPSSAPPAARVARIVETVALGASAAVIIAMSATWTSTGGLMLMLDKLQPAYATANIIMFSCAVAGAVIAVLIALFGRTVAGTITMAVVLIGYGVALNGGSYQGSWFLPKEMTETAIEYTIDIDGTNVEGAELSVNGVYLGKAPYTTTLAEFEAKVPYWPEPPADYETDRVKTPRYGTRSTSTSIRCTWIKLWMPRHPSQPMHGPDTQPNQEQKSYYARVRYADEWGVGNGGSGSGGAGGGLIRRANSHFGVTFPQRQKRLDTLLDKARLADYRVGPEWFETIETYNEDGWIALREAGDHEPGMMEVLDAWATWRYDLDKVTSAETAWEVFQRICREAREQGQYLTPSVAGRAVELLMGKLPTDRLLDRATRLIRNSGSFGLFKWRMNGRLQFGYRIGQGRLRLGGDGSIFSGFSGGKIGAPQLPMDAYTVAHAVWMLYATDPAVVQERIVPEIVRWQYKAGLVDPLLVAASFGGPAIDQFLLRQSWRAGLRDQGWDDQLRLSGVEANKWLYLLAYLNDDAGRRFRRKRTAAVMNLADTFYEEGFVSWQAQIDFIFMDAWLAREYWPRFARLARQKSPHYAL